MAAAKQNKAPGRQESIRRILGSLEKRYGAIYREPDEQPMLETLIYAICLENSTFAEASTYCGRIETLFHDFNEARVSSITELSRIFQKSPVAEIKAYCFRHLLTHVFELFYAFDFDSLLLKSNEQANRLLRRVPELSQFARNHTVKQCMDVHLLPVDDRMRDALAWLGMGTVGQTPQRTGSALKTDVRKGDVDRFCGLVRCLATDPKAIKIMVADIDETEGIGFELSTTVERLKSLFVEIDTRKPKPAAKKTTATKKAAKTNE